MNDFINELRHIPFKQTTRAFSVKTLLSLSTCRLSGTAMPLFCEYGTVCNAVKQLMLGDMGPSGGSKAPILTGTATASPDAKHLVGYSHLLNVTVHELSGRICVLHDMRYFFFFFIFLNAWLQVYVLGKYILLMLIYYAIR